MRMIREFLGIVALSGAVQSLDVARSNSPLANFPWEQVELTQAEASNPKLAGYLRFGDEKQISPLADRKCRVFPTDPDWPAQSVWQELNTTLHGALLKPQPLASICYKQTVYNDYDEAACKSLSSHWPKDIVRMNHPIEAVSPMFQGMTCLPPSDKDTKGCVQGGYPVYTVNVSTVAHVQAAVNFARNTGIRLVIKNTGHDFSGKSVGAGALSVWTHNLKDIEFYPNFTYADGYTGPAFKVGSGVQALEVLEAAAAKKHIVATGVCDSVGIYGGYAQGGGHSPLSITRGLGADQILSLGIVTADGQFRNASTTENPDLFWAVRGGGGGTFGIVTSMVVKAYPDEKTAVGTFEWGVTGPNSMVTPDLFWTGIQTYFSWYKNLTDQNIFATWNIFAPGSTQNQVPGGPPPGSGPKIEIKPMLAVGKTLAQLKAATKPWLDDMAAAGINFTTSWLEFPTYLPAYSSNLPHSDTNVMPYTMAYASRLIPRENFDPARKLNETVAAFRTLNSGGHNFNGYMFAPVAPAGVSNAVLPAWRTAYSHTIVFVNWDAHTSVSEQMAIRRKFAVEEMQVLRDATPESGSYLSESDRLEPEWQKAFYGANYPRLLEIKNKYDPGELFYAVQAVGSEGWVVQSVDGLPNENGQLCRA